ncbi:MAG: polysaccharide deacetylase family protein [Deltaproteobacteria bacterium]|nr:polysaccharide deacetylase family protein [Deltaproteobacteria bacterium]
MKQISLLYHDVVKNENDAGASGFPGADADIYKLDEANFSAHLARIAELGQDRVQVVGRGGELSAAGGAPVLFTFDDGGVSAHEPTARLLEARGWRGHFFVVTERVGQPGFLSREQIVDLHRRGHHIGSHSHSHPSRFSQIGWEKMVHEWKESRRILEEILGQPVWSASVPGGFYSRQVARAAREAGYTVMFNSEPDARVSRVEGLVLLGRYGIQRQTTPELAQSLARADFLPRASQAVTWNAKKPLKKIGGKLWLSFRRWFFKKS